MMKETWKDTLLKVLIGVLVSSLGWFAVWAQDVATKKWVEDNSEIILKVPSLSADLRRVNIHRDKIEALEKNDIRLAQILENLEHTTEQLQKTVVELTKEVMSLKIEIARANR